MSFYDSLAKTATNLLKKFGQSITFTRYTTGVYDPITASAAVSPSTFKGYGAAFDYTSDEVTNSNILSTDVRLLVNKTKVAPEVNDHAVVSGKNMVVISVNTTSPAGQDVIHECQMRVGEGGNGTSNI